jgi:hypothetical protein
MEIWNLPNRSKIIPIEMYQYSKLLVDIFFPYFLWAKTKALILLLESCLRFVASISFLWQL